MWFLPSFPIGSSIVSAIFSWFLGNHDLLPSTKTLVQLHRGTHVRTRACTCMHVNRLIFFSLHVQERGNLERSELVQDLVRSVPTLTSPELVWEVNQLTVRPRSHCTHTLHAHTRYMHTHSAHTRLIPGGLGCSERNDKDSNTRI